MTEKLVFNIKEVADIIGVVPTTIRNWEKQKLFVAKRKSNNYRYYSLDDIDLLKKIKSYSIDQRINSNIIKTLIGNDSALDIKPIYDAQNQSTDKLLSHKWKESREKLGYTLEDVSKSTNISISYLSKIENGQANISINILNRLANFYKESILYFVEKRKNYSKVVRKNSRDIIDIGIKGVSLESLAGIKDNFLFPIIYNIEPGCGSLEKHKHNGEEFIYVISGKLKVSIENDEVYILRKNDSIIFKSSETHEWKNVDKKITKLLWVHSPISR